MDNKKIAVKCSTTEEKEEVIKYACKEEKAHYTPPDYSDCITLNKGTHSNETWYKNNGYTIISYEEFERDYLEKKVEKKRVNTYTDYEFTPGEIYVGSWGIAPKKEVIFKLLTNKLSGKCWGIDCKGLYFTQNGTCNSDGMSYREAIPEEKQWLEACIAAGKSLSKERALKSKIMKYNFEVGKYYYFEAYNTKQPTYVKVSSIDNEGLNAEYYIYLIGKDTGNYYIGIGRWSLDQVNNPREATLSELSPYLPVGHPDKISVLLTPEEGKWYKVEVKSNTIIPGELIWLFKSKKGERLTYASKGVYLKDNDKFTNNAVTNDDEIVSLEPADMEEVYKYFPEEKPENMKKEIKDLVYPYAVHVKNKEEWEKLKPFHKNLTDWSPEYDYYLMGFSGKKQGKYTGNASYNNGPYINIEFSDIIFPYTKEEEFCLKVGEEYEYGLQAGIWMVDEIGSDKIYFKSKESGRRVDYYRHQFPGLLNPTQFHLVKSKEKSMKFNIGDKVKFKTSSEYIPSYGTDHNGIPRDIIRHGSTIFKENKGVIIHIYEDWYIVSFTDTQNRDVHLGFKEDVLKPYIEEKPKPTNLVGRWVKCLKDEAWSSTFKGSYVKKDHYYQLYDIRGGTYYGLEGGNYCGALSYGEDQNLWKAIDFELMPEGFVPNKVEKDIVLKKGMYLKALIDRPESGDVKKGEYGKITYVNGYGGGHADFPSQKTYSFTYIKEQGRYELMPEGWTPEVKNEEWIPQVGEYAVMEAAGGWGYRPENNGCVALINSVKPYRAAPSCVPVDTYAISGTVINPNLVGQFTDFSGIPIRTDKGYICRKALPHEIPVKELDYSHFATITEGGYGISPLDRGKKVKVLLRKPKGKIANDYYDTYWAPVEGVIYSTLGDMYQYGCCMGDKSLSIFYTPVEEENFKVGDWVVFEVERARKINLKTDFWCEDKVLKIDSIDGDNLRFDGCSNSKKCFRKAFSHEIPSTTKIETHYNWCIKRTKGNTQSIIDYFNKFHNKGYVGNGTYYGIKEGSAECSSYPWGKTLSTEEFYHLIGAEKKEPLYVTAIDPYDKVEEKTVLVNLIQHKKGGILDTRVNSTYSVNEDLIKPKKVVLF